MTTPSEQWVVNALRQATDTMSLPPESRWIHERRSTAGASTIAMVAAAAILIIAVAGAIGALRVEPRVVPATQVDAFAAAEDAAWARVLAALASDFLVLRPTWIPAEFRGSVECPSPVSGPVAYPGPRGDRTSFEFRYLSRHLADGRCGFLNVVANSTGTAGMGHDNGAAVDVGTIDARGTTVRITTELPNYRDERPQAPRQTYLWWSESGVNYEVGSNDIELADLIRVVRGLEPAR